MMKWTTDMVAVTASFNEDWRRNRPRKLSRRLWLSPWQFLSRKNCCSSPGFCLGTTHQVHTATFVQGSLAANISRRSPPIRKISTQQTFFTFQKRAGLPLVIARGHADYHWRWVRHPLSAVVWALRSLHLDQWQLPWEKLRNKHNFDSNHGLFIELFKSDLIPSHT
jgi:hypothetical protein